MEFLFNNFEFLRVGEGVLGAYDFFKLVSKTRALFYVDFDLYFSFLLSSVADVLLKRLYLLVLLAALKV